MPIIPDDPRLTAYALGDLNEAERPEIENLIAADADARAFVEDVKATARLLSAELRAELSPGLAPQHRQAIETQLEPAPGPKAHRAAISRRRWAGVAIAASLLGLSGTLLISAIREARRERQVTALALNEWGQVVHREAEVARPAARPLAAPAAAQSTSVASPQTLRSGIAGPPAAPVPYGFDFAMDKPAEDFITSGRSVQQADRAPGELPALDRNRALGGLVDQRREAGSRGGEKRVLAYQPSIPVGGTTTLPKGKLEESLASKKSKNPEVESLARRDSSSTTRAMGVELQQSGTTVVTGEVSASRYKSKPAKPEEPDLAAGAKPANSAPSPPARQLFQMQAAVDQLGRASKTQGAVEGVADKAEALPEADTKLANLAVADLKKELPPPSAPRTLDELVVERRKKLEDEKAGGEAFQPIVDNPFLTVIENPLSTFSIDVDTASYANVRRYLNQNTLPPRDAVRIEELVNYFPYRYPAPKADEPFSVSCEVARCPWDAGHRLVRIGLKGREVDVEKRPPSNLVFLIDVSGSMQDLDKLPLLKAGMKLLVEQLGENDRVAIVVYAGQKGLALDSTRCDHKASILSTLEQLQAGGSTNGGSGIQLAYDVAVRNFIKGGTNRVILATDGDFNVGVTEGPDLDRLIEEKRQSGVFLSVLGFGQGNVKHNKLESLADKGNGNYSFIDSIKEARKVLVEQMGGTLVAIAKDVKVQVVFNPDRASAFRLIGYENRMLQDRDFEDDRKDAGEVGAGHCVTALYEVVPAGQGAQALTNNQASKYAQQAAKGNSRLMEVRLRFKAPDGDVSRLISSPIDDDGRDFAAASADLRFASSVAGFGMLLRVSPHRGSLTWGGLLELASGSIGDDPGGYRAEFLDLVRKAQAISSR